MATAVECRSTFACACLVSTAFRLNRASVLAAFLSVLPAYTLGENQPPPSRERPISGEVADRLRTTISSIEFDGLALESSFQKLSEACGVPIQPDWTALAALRITKDTQINLKCSNARARQVLSLILREVIPNVNIDLGYFQDGSVVRVTTGPSPFRRNVPQNVDELLITIRPPSNSTWLEHGPGEVLPSQRLAGWTNVNSHHEKEDVGHLRVKNSEVERKLNKLVAFDLQGVGFDSALNRLVAISEIKIEADWQGLEAQAIEKESEVNLKMQNVRVRQILDVMLGECGEPELTWFVDGDMVRVTLKDEHLRSPAYRGCKSESANGPPNSGSVVSNGSSHDLSDDGSLPVECAETAFEKRLQATIPELVLQNVSFKDALEKLATIGGLSIVPNWMALEAQAIEKDTVVNLRLMNVQLGKAILLLLEEVGGGEVELMYMVEGELVRISTKEDLSRKRTIVVYSVGDILSVVDRDVWPLPKKDDKLAKLQSPIDALSALIRETVDPESWRENGGNVGTIQPMKDSLIVSQTKWGHDQISSILSDLRDAYHSSITIDAQVIRIEAGAEVAFRQSTANFPFFDPPAFAQLEGVNKGRARLCRCNGTVSVYGTLALESHWQRAPTNSAFAGTLFAIHTKFSPYVAAKNNAIRLAVNLELIGPVDLPVGSSAVTGPRDVSPANWKAAGVKTWQVRRVSTVVTVKAGEAIALMIPPENPGQVDGSSSDWILIRPHLQK